MGLKHPHQADGTVTYTRLTGDVRMVDVDFGYEKNKIVLHNIIPLRRARTKGGVCRRHRCGKNNHYEPAEPFL